MRSSRRAAAPLLSVVASVALIGSAAATAAAEPGPTDVAAEEADVQPTYIVLDLDHPVSVPDAADLADEIEASVGMDVYGLRHEQPRLQGEYYLDSGQSIEDFLATFESDFTPEVVALLAVQFEGASDAAARTQVVEAADLVLSQSAALPVHEAEPAAGDGVELQQVIDRSGVLDDGTVSAAQLAGPTWFPSYNEIYALNSDPAGRRVATYSIWGGGSGNSPDLIPDDWGIEIDTYQYNDAMVGVRPACATGVNMAFWANKGSGPSGIHSYAVYNRLGELDHGDVGAYFDWVDASDACSDQSLSVGIGYANELANHANDPETGIVVLQTVINTTPGNFGSSPMSVNIQAVSNDCNDLSRGPASDCMGLNTDRDFPLSPQNHVVSGKSNGYSFPGCFYTHWDATAQQMDCPYPS